MEKLEVLLSYFSKDLNLPKPVSYELITPPLCHSSKTNTNNSKWGYE